MIERDDAADDLLRTLIQDLLPYVRLDEVFSSCIVTTKALLRWNAAGAVGAPHAVWNEIRRRAPRAASFPLGPPAERAARRLVLSIRRTGAINARELLHRHLSLLVFEIALMNLRGSSEDIADDFGFWYHWHPDGRFRSIEDEAQTRTRLWRASARLASSLLRAWAAHRTEACATDEDVDATLRDALESAVVPRRRPGRTVTVLGVKWSASLEKAHRIDRAAPQIVLDGRHATVQLHDRELLAACGGALDSRVRDLLDIATVFYFADIAIRRNALFARDLTFLMPVRDPGLWTGNERTVARIGAFLTGNNVAFRFIAHPDGRARARKLHVSEDERCVALFSGGLDSFAGATQARIEKRVPVLVSHAASPALAGLQRRLLQGLRPNGRLESVSVRTSAVKGVPVMHQLRLPQTELYQHGRSFLFASLAAAVALSKGIRDLRIYENGPVALNVPFSEARFNTRTTHPIFFDLFHDLVRDVFEIELHLENPFALMTKGEVVSLIPERDRTAVGLTNSCWGYARVSWFAKLAGVSRFRGTHCGRCVPCVWRRAAIGRAGLEKFDGGYLWDSVPARTWGRFLDRKHLTVLLDLYRASTAAVASESDDALLALAPEIDEIGPGTLPDRLAMHRRYAKEIVDYFDTQSARLVYRTTDAK